MTTTTLVAIMKDERPYVIEWVAYHRLIGFDRLVVYSNDCTDGTDTLLDRLAALALVEHRRWPGVPGVPPQQSAYADAVPRCDTPWIMFLDADEFLNLIQHDRVADWLAILPADASAVAVSWRVFGSGGRQAYSTEPVLERFTRAAPVFDRINFLTKTIAVTEDIGLADIHHVVLKRGRYVAASGVDAVFRSPNHLQPRPRFALVNHYLLKSREEYAHKRARGMSGMAPDDPGRITARGPDYFDYHDRNEEEDRSIQRWLPALRAEMARIEALL